MKKIEEYSDRELQERQLTMLGNSENHLKRISWWVTFMGIVTLIGVIYVVVTILDSTDLPY